MHSSRIRLARYSLPDDEDLNVLPQGICLGINLGEGMVKAGARARACCLPAPPSSTIAPEPAACYHATNETKSLLLSLEA
jgi:hypothetical protein